MTLRLVYSRPAKADLDAIFDYIAVDNPQRALSYVQEIETACGTLRDAPLIGAKRPDIRPGIRILPLWRRIVVAYELPPGRVRILRVFSGGQDYDALMAR